MPRIILMVTLRDCYKCISPMQSVINVFIFRCWRSAESAGGLKSSSSYEIYITKRYLLHNIELNAIFISEVSQTPFFQL